MFKRIKPKKYLATLVLIISTLNADSLLVTFGYEQGGDTLVIDSTQSSPINSGASILVGYGIPLVEDLFDIRVELGRMGSLNVNGADYSSYFVKSLITMNFFEAVNIGAGLHYDFVSEYSSITSPTISSKPGMTYVVEYFMDTPITLGRTTGLPYFGLRYTELSYTESVTNQSIKGNSIGFYFGLYGYN